nr:putative transcription factor interactor and regulator CCHC(Zn) family [Tanacetum cinerariifolium]
MVMSWILNSMKRNIAEIFSYSESSKDFWEAVRDMYGNQNNSARIFQIQLDIDNLLQDGNSFLNLLGKLKGLWNELEVYRPHSVDPKFLRKRHEDDQVFQLLASLGPDFEELKRHILLNAKLPTLKSVCATIQREKVRRKVMINDATAPEALATSLSQFLKFPMAEGVRVGKGTALAANETQAARDKATGKRSAAEGTYRRTKTKTGAPLTFALDESEGDDSTRTSFGTHHFASPLNTIIFDDVDPATGEGSLVLESVRREEDDADRSLDNVEDGTEADSPPINHPLGPQQANHSDEDTYVHYGGLHHDERDEQAHRHASGSSDKLRLAFPKRNPGGDGVGSSLRGDAVPPTLFVPAWNLTTHCILNDAESCRDMMINLATPVVRDQQSRLSDYHALQRSWFKLGRGAFAQIDLLQ